MKIKKLLPVILSTILISSILIVCNSGQLLSSWHLRLSDKFHGHGEVSDQIVIVGIDQKTLDNNEGLGATANWDYNVFIDLIKNLSQANTISFDIIFNTENPLQKEIANEFSKNKTILARWSNIYEGYTKTGVFINADNNQGLREPIDIYKNAATLLGDIMSLINEDDIIRDRNFGVISNKQIYENLSLATARSYLGLENEIGIYDQKAKIYYLDSNKSIGIPVDRNETQFKIRFFSDPFGYKYYSFIDVARGLVNSSEFKDKIILIGPTDPIFQDTRSVPSSNKVAMPGVEIHANAIQTILDQAFLVDQSPSMQALTILGLSIISSIAFMYLGILASVIFLITGCLAYTFIARFSFDQGIIINMIYPYLAMILSFSTIYLYRYFTEIKAKQELKSAFSKYVNPDIVKEIANNPESLQLGGQAREVTIFFSDIENFTHVSEGLNAHDLVALLNEYFEVMGSIIMKNHGTLDKFEGDAIMAFWNAPLDLENHAYYACLAAIEGKQALEALHSKWQAEGKPLLNYRVGLNLGEAVIGNVGSKDRFDYTAMGDTINLGSRLESINKQYGTYLCISESVYERVKENFICRKLDKIKVKGKDLPVVIYELIGLKDNIAPEALNLISNFETALDLYQNKNFTEAISKFQEVLNLRQEDGPSQIYIKRCQAFLQSPPPIEWDGVWVFESK